MSHPAADQQSYPFVLPELPYAPESLEPHISRDTIGFHHGKHHQTYVTKLNELMKDSDLQGESLEDIIRQTAGNPDRAAIFNNAAQIWNHTFYWHSMKPNGGGKPSGKLEEMINNDFGSYDAFADAFKQAAMTQFGSGWAWLVVEDGKLSITKTGNAQLPITHGQIPLLTIDVWEHAYYLDYQNRRPDYASTFLEKLVNWEFAEANLQRA